jgi:hypothetical protein
MEEILVHRVRYHRRVHQSQVVDAIGKNSVPQKDLKADNNQDGSNSKCKIFRALGYCSISTVFGDLPPEEPN